MVTAADLPHVHPQFVSRPLTADEVLDLAQLKDIPGVDPDDPRVQSIQRARIGIASHETWRKAREHGYLVISRAFLPEYADRAKILTLWGWWCAAAGRPEVTIETFVGTDAVEVRCDLSPARCRWTFGALHQISRLLTGLPASDDDGWIFTTDELQLDGLCMDDAVVVARAIVAMVRSGRMTVADGSD